MRGGKLRFSRHAGVLAGRRSRTGVWCRAGGLGPSAIMSCVVRGARGRCLRRARQRSFHGIRPSSQPLVLLDPRRRHAHPRHGEARRRVRDARRRADRPRLHVRHPRARPRVPQVQRRPEEHEAVAPRRRVLPEGVGARGARGRPRGRVLLRRRPCAVGERLQGVGGERTRPRGRARQPPAPQGQADLRLRGLLHHRRLHRARHAAAPLPPDPAREERDGLRQPHQVHVQGRRPRDDVLQAPHHAGHAEGVPRGAHLPERLRPGHHPAAHPRRPVRRGARVGADLQGHLRRRLLHGDPGPRAQLQERIRRPLPRREAREPRPRARHQGHRHQRLPLPHPRGRADPGHPLVHRQGHDPRRPQPHAHGRHRVLHEERAGDARALLMVPRGLRQHPRGRREVRLRARLGLHVPARVPRASRGRDGRPALPRGVREGPRPPLRRRLA